MATAVLAGANPMAGLYASIAGPLAGGLVTSTTVMIVATTSAAAVTASPVMGPGLSDPAGTLATLTALSGLFMLAATLLGFARLIRFVSASVMGGFLFGVGLLLILGQLADATGVSAQGPNVLAKALDTVTQVQSFHWPSVFTALGAIVITGALSRGKLTSVAPLLGIAAPMVVLLLTGSRVATVGDSGPITLGLPPLVLPNPTLITPDLVSAAAALAFVVLVQAAGVSAAYPNAEGPANDVRRDFLAQSAANVASAVVGGIPVGGSVGQTAVNVLAGARSRWAGVISGIWMLAIVAALGPVLAAVPIPALAGLLILAGIMSLRPERIRQSRAAGKSSFAAALVTMVATLLAPIQIAVLTGILLSLLLVALNAAKVHVVGLERRSPGLWRRVDAPGRAVAGTITVVDVEGAGVFASVPELFEQLPAHPSEGPAAVVVRMRGHIRPSLTLALALGAYHDRLAAARTSLTVCGLKPEILERLRAMGVPEAIALVPESAELEGSLEDAFLLAEAALRGTSEPGPPPASEDVTPDG